MARRDGGCACGAVRYRVAKDPIFVNNCHCTLCQKQTGGTSVVNAFIEGEAVTLLCGELSRHTVKTGSGGDQTIFRCITCGTALWSSYPRLGELGLGLRVSTLDDAGSITPDAVIFTDFALPWVTLPDGIPHFATTYRYDELLPPERLARMQALVEKRAAQKVVEA